MKKQLFGLVALVTLFPCALFGAPLTGLTSFDAAVDSVVSGVMGKIPKGVPIGVYEVTAPSSGIQDYLTEEFIHRFETKGNKVVALGKDKAAVEGEMMLQMSGLVDDATVVKAGRRLGVQVAIKGSMSCFGNAAQLRMWALDVDTGKLIGIYPALVRNNDAVLTGFTEKALAGRNFAVIDKDTLDHFNKGMDAYTVGRFEEALDEYGRAIALNNRFGEAYFHRSGVYWERKDYLRMLADLTLVLTLDPNDDRAYNNRGIAYADGSKDYDQAIADYTQAIKRNPNFALAYLNRGVAYYEKEDYDRAIADYTQAIKLEPNNAKAFSNRGTAYMKGKKDFDRAIADFNQAIKLDPNGGFYIYNNRGSAYSENGDYDLAIADFNQAITLNPNAALAYYNRGNVYYKKEAFDRAIADYTQSLTLDPNYAEAYSGRGNAFFELGDIRALADYNQAIKLDPDNAKTYTVRGFVHFAKKDYDRARADFEKAAQLDPNGEVGQGARQLLEGMKRMGY